ncbi:divergent PAP2 family protein [Marinithermus hydrothermalis]|uniref:Acid phosphatase/vanadium-dependent haloperoxidase related protein n=1 Tax=Marinithermus hydrothermalis (strain DSM 14884 / JCM 11576 / T1) TaxID=869210 RepID=F2NNY3_MARHT|nr:divergent PAP2 family protein [Marinithermus hydrothermalis]AEB11571.1 acid phosphatase/vanadium-dependent haloperoxidase related protein [Marinithermus hydrothermalis DSM 14884]
MSELLGNQILWTALAANVIAQSLKLVIYYLINGRWEWERFLETGGMPSSHSATVAAAVVGVGLTEGWGSPLFAVTTVFALIVMYDATGIRRAAGRQAELLNDLVEELQVVLHEGFKPEPLKELLGHTYLEVAVGALLGGVVAWGSFTLW